MRRCSSCKESKEETEFYIRQSKCKSCTMIARYEYYSRIKTEALAILGNKCVRCGFDDLRALQIDHINEDGGEDRKHKTKKNNAYLYRRIIKGDAADLQLLCANCNCIKAWESGSFHKTSVRGDVDNCH